MSTDKKLNVILLLSRVFVGTVVLAHGFQKLFGWFGGYGFDGTIGFFTEVIGLPYIFGFLIIMAESVGMIALILGLLGRYMAIALILIMIGAIVTTHVPFGFFMNWEGNQSGEGYEFHLLVIASALVTAILGSGTYSLDHLFMNKKQEQKQPTYA